MSSTVQTTNVFLSVDPRLLRLILNFELCGNGK